VIAARQHMIVAEQILAPRIVLDKRAESPAAAVRDRTAMSIEIVIVPAGTPQRHQSLQRTLVSHGVAVHSRRIQQDFRFRLRPSDRSHHVSCAGRRNCRGSRVGY